MTQTEEALLLRLEAMRVRAVAAETKVRRVQDLVKTTDGDWLRGEDFNGLAGAIQEVVA